MFVFLDNLRKKPKNIRERYAFFGAIGITATIALVWFGLVQIASNDTTPRVDLEDETSSFSTFYDELKDRVQATTDALQGTFEYVSDEPATTTPTGPQLSDDAFVAPPETTNATTASSGERTKSHAVIIATTTTKTADE